MFETRGNCEQEKTYTVDDIRRLLGVSKSTACRIVRANLFHSTFRNGEYEIPQQDFERWLSSLQAET